MKIAVVTGASSGMGREMIIQLWEHFKGFDEMLIIARREGRLEELDRHCLLYTSARTSTATASQDNIYS